MAIRRTGDRFVVEFQQAGRRVFRRCPPGITRADAARFEAELRRTAFREVRLGETPVVPLAAAIQLWVKETSATKRDHKKPGQLAALLAPFVGSKPLAEAPKAAQECVAAWSGTLTPATINRRLAVLKAACKHAWRRGLIEHNLSGRIPLLREPPGREVYLSKPEIAALAAAATDERVRATIMLLAYSGMRVSELLAMGALPSDAEAFPIPDSKTRKPRRVPIVNTIRPYLPLLPLGMPYRTLIDGFWQARKAAGMEHVRLHDLRHTTASLLAAQGVPLHQIAEILGDHLLTARRYAHLCHDTLTESMRKIG